MIKLGTKVRISNTPHNAPKSMNDKEGKIIAYNSWCVGYLVEIEGNKDGHNGEFEKSAHETWLDGYSDRSGHHNRWWFSETELTPIKEG